MTHEDIKCGVMNDLNHEKDGQNTVGQCDAQVNGKPGSTSIRDESDL